MSTTVVAPRHAATACWQPTCANRALMIYRDDVPIATIPLPDVGTAPSQASLDDMVATLGFTRTSTWLPAGHGLLADVEPTRPTEGSKP